MPIQGADKTLELVVEREDEERRQSTLELETRKLSREIPPTAIFDTGTTPAQETSTRCDGEQGQGTTTAQPPQETNLVPVVAEGGSYSKAQPKPKAVLSGHVKGEQSRQDPDPNKHLPILPSTFLPVASLDTIWPFHASAGRLNFV